MFTVASLLIFTIVFLISKLENKFNIIVLLVYVLPFFYGYLHILPNSIKILPSFFMLLITVEILLYNKKVLNRMRKRKIGNLIIKYSVLLLLVLLTTTIINQGSLVLLLLELRKLFYPFFFYLIFEYYSFIKQKLYSFETKMKKIMLLQVIIIPLQYYFYDEYIDYLPILFRKMDSAAGTWGIGTSLLGVMMVVYFVYYYLATKKIISFLFLTPLIFIFSGGAIFLLMIAFVSIVMFEKINLKRYIRLGMLLLLLFGSVQVVSSYFFKYSLINYTTNYFIRAYDSQSQGDYLTKGNRKVVRLRALSYADYQLEEYNNRLLGFGNDVYFKSNILKTTSNKFEVDEIMSLAPELMLKYGYIGLCVFIGFWGYLVFYFYKNRKYKYGKVLFILFVINLLSFMYTKPIYYAPFLFFLFFLIKKFEVEQEYYKIIKK